MRYLPHTTEEITDMLAAVGVRDLKDLFNTVPDNCCTLTHLALPEALSEWDLNRHMEGLAATMAASPHYRVFMGAGSYDHYVPAAVSYLLSQRKSR